MKTKFTFNYVIFIVAFTFGLSILMKPYCIHAQGNIKFSKVIQVGNAAATVPVGKIWKLNSFSRNGKNWKADSTSTEIKFGHGTARFPYHIYARFLVTGMIGTTLFSGYIIPVPIWLPAGCSIATEKRKDILTVLEFDIGSDKK